MTKGSGAKGFELRIRTLEEIHEGYRTRKGYRYVLSEASFSPAPLRISYLWSI